MSWFIQKMSQKTGKWFWETFQKYFFSTRWKYGFPGSVSLCQRKTAVKHIRKTEC